MLLLSTYETGTTMNYQKNKELVSPDKTDVVNEMCVTTNETEAYVATDFNNVEDSVDFNAHPSHETTANSTSRRIHKQRYPKIINMITQEPVKPNQMSDNQVTIKRLEAEEVDYQTEHVRRFHCYICGKRFIQFSHLKHHLHMHTAYKPYSCKICRQRCSRSEYKSVHTQCHFNNKIHHCHVCGKMYLDVARSADHSRWRSNSDYRDIAIGDTAGEREENFRRQIQIAENEILLSIFLQQLKLESCVVIEKIDNSADDKEHMHCQHSS